MDYFGKPVYTYSLKQGIDDGFLAPYKVIRVTTTVDDGWRPTRGLIDKYGNAITDRIYNLKDYDRNIAIDERTELVAARITEYLKGFDRFAKTIVFCVDIDHANRMRMALINANGRPRRAAPLTTSSRSPAMTSTASRSSTISLMWRSGSPVIATTSKMLTTGMDTKMTKLIVLEANIGSMTEFKQIIGRGTRLRVGDGKVYFTILDFRKATNLFADPDFDGDPVQIYEPGIGDPILPPDVEEDLGRDTMRDQLVSGADAGAELEGQGADVGIPPSPPEGGETTRHYRLM